MLFFNNKPFDKGLWHDSNYSTNTAAPTQNELDQYIISSVFRNNCIIKYAVTITWNAFTTLLQTVIRPTKNYLAYKSVT